MAREERGGGDPETVTLPVPLPRRVAQDLVALAELYHATPEQMVASWAQTHVDNLMAGLTPDGAPPQDRPQSAVPRLAPARSEPPPDTSGACDTSP